MYQVLFTGRRNPEIDRKQVEANLQRLFKANARQVAWFLRGAPIVVKTTDDFEVAEKYHKALTEAGLICTLSAVPAPKEVAKRAKTPAPPPAVTPPSHAPAQKPVQVPLAGLEPEPAREPRPARPPPAQTVPAPSAPPPAPPPERPTPPEPPPVAAPPAPPVAPPVETPAPAPASPPVQVQVPVPVKSVDSPPSPSPLPPPPESRIPPRRFEDAIPDVLEPVSGLPEPPPGRVRWLVLGIVAALVVGVVLWWFLRESAAPPVELPPAAEPQAEKPATPPPMIAPKELAKLIRGRWFCLYGPRPREEVVFDKNGEFRSLQYGNPDSPVPEERENLEMRGLYWISDNTVIVHVMVMPLLESYGRSPMVDEHAVIRVLHINERSLVWNIPRLDRSEQPCLHASVELYGSAKKNG